MRLMISNLPVRNDRLSERHDDEKFYETVRGIEIMTTINWQNQSNPLPSLSIKSGTHGVKTTMTVDVVQREKITSRFSMLAEKMGRIASSSPPAPEKNFDGKPWVHYFGIILSSRLKSRSYDDSGMSDPAAIELDGKVFSLL
ncbi:MAG: hypothetical protein M5U34_37935 [Chloroflexi bacterium]|nr:hypothetical protein [Chloroflexota bacterium]